MKIDGKDITLEFKEDYEFIKLISYVIKIKYGEVKLKIRNGKPYQMVDIQKSILLTKDVDKNPEDYGE
jgi:hypothetical protein